MYKALMIDVDGTLSRYSSTDLPLLPSKAVVSSIEQAKKLLSIGLATSRPLSKLRDIFQLLNLNGYSILHNGAQIVDANLNNVWSRPLESDSLKRLYEIAMEHKIRTYYSDFSGNKPLSDINEVMAVPISDIFFDGVKKKQYGAVKNDLKEIENIIVHQLSSRWEDGYELSITHHEATKKSAIFEVANLLEITPDEIIGIGDAHNDLLLLEACGYKVAMGNAVEELKKIADYIAPPVEEEGVAVFITNFIADQARKGE